MKPRAAGLIAKQLIVLALCVRALLPSGWMPVVENGAIALQPCPTAGLSSPIEKPSEPMVMASHGDHHQIDAHEGHDQSTSETCPFGVVSTGVADLPPLQALELPHEAGAALLPSPLSDITELQRFRSPFLARGPPSFA